MNELQVTARFRVRQGQLDAFKAAADRCMASVRERDTGTLRYDWFFNAEQTECVVREMYRDSDALLEHVANLGENMGALLAAADLDIELFGEPSSQLLEATAGLAPRIYTPFR
ncbi:MAG: antibiotic biosynthesis monooxygenase [Wenzhouxiangellaceae bacterium]|nr:antibiotic biosynthesis monooxygenase [Wenzhouxiangellaceae bacterium]